MNLFSSSRYVLGAAVLLAVGGSPAVAEQATWNAAVDLRANELNPATELLNPNGTVPQWSYGYRGSVNSSDVTLLTAADHSNTILGSLQGWNPGGTATLPFSPGGFITAVDVSQAVPSHVLLSPTIGNTGGTRYNVTRFTASVAGNYAVTASWQDLANLPGENGAYAYVVRGVSLEPGFTTGNALTGTLAEGATLTFANTFTLAAGESLDFLVGTGPTTGGLASDNGDRIAFNAVISVPEPATALGLAGVGALACGRRNRVRRCSTPQL